MTEILLRCNDIEMPKIGTLTLVVHPNGDAYLGDVLKDVKIGEATELLSHGRCIDADELEKVVEKMVVCDSCEYTFAHQMIKGLLKMAPTVLETTE